MALTVSALETRFCTAFDEARAKPPTDHQLRVYEALLDVPAGKVTTYKALADRIGSSPRAVGQALRGNPFAPHVPCHRVISSDGFIGGFSGQWTPSAGRAASLTLKENTQRKVDLLVSEGVTVPPSGYIEPKFFV